MSRTNKIETRRALDEYTAEALLRDGVAIAPLFRNPPATRREEFYKRLLEANATMGGMAGFALQPDGWVVLHAGRSRKGLDAHELAMLVSSVGRFADELDDKLIAEFFAARAPDPEAAE